MSQLQQLCDHLKIKSVATYGGEVPEGFSADSHPYKVRLTFEGRSLTIPFFMGSACRDEPTAADVINCLCLDLRAGEQDFEEFCSDFGYDADSRKAKALHEKCARMAPRVKRFLGAAFEELAAAEH